MLPSARSIMPVTRPALSALLIAMLLALAGCGGEGQTGYSSRELFPQNVRTVKLNIFANRSFYQGVEMDLTEALSKEIELRTPYKVTNAAGADTLLTGTVLSVNQSVLSRTIEAGLPQEMQTTITVSFEWKDLRSGQVIRRRDRIVGTGEYVPTRTAGQPYEVSQHQAIAELARDIVSVMRSDW